MRKTLVLLAMLIGLIVVQLPQNTGARENAHGAAFAEDPTPPPTPLPPPPPPLG